VAHFRGEINIIDDCNINELIFSQITPQILVGSYPRSVMDIHKLKENKVSAIFSIQSERDFKSHGLTPYFLSLICQEQGIKYKRCSILDMNNDDFINKAEGGVKMMRDLIKDGEKVYVHCSAGIYRSPQMIALYLTLFEKYSIEQAVNTIKASHPYAKPNCKVIRDAIGLMQLHRTNRMVLI
jgi:protein-tyrosine phosphatase